MSVQSAGSTKTVSYLQSLLQPAAKSKTTGVSDPLAALFAAFTGGKTSEADAAEETPASGNAGCPQFSPGTMASLIAMQGQQATSTTSLLGQFDADGNGAISQSEFETAIGPDADTSKVDALFGKIDTGGDGDISPDELQAAVDKAQQSQITRRGHHHHHHGISGAGAPAQDSAASVLPSTDVTGAADGASPADTADKPGQALASMKSFLEKLMQLQAQMLAQQAQQTTTAVTA
jgi:hypothetical protein